MPRRDYGGGALEQRDAERWLLTVELGRDPISGRRRRRRETVRGSKRDAQRRLRAMLSERDTAGVDPSKITTGEWLTHALGRRVADGEIGPRTVENYRAIIRIHLAALIGNVKLQDLRTEHVLAVRTAVGESVTPATTKTVLGFLRQSLDAAVVAQLIATNPAAAVPNPSQAGAHRERRALSEAEIGELLEAATETAHDVPIRFAVATGVRQGELLGAAWESVDLEAGTFEVRQTLALQAGEPTMLPPKTKNSRRTIELSAATIAQLRRHRAAQNEERLRLGSVWADEGLVFPALDGRPWSRHTFYDGFRRILARTAIAEPSTVNWHTLRHSAASLWIKSGADVFTVSRRLGHGSPAFTMSTYAHLLKGQQRAAAEALDHLIG